jgi:hypothetical protein
VTFTAPTFLVGHARLVAGPGPPGLRDAALFADILLYAFVAAVCAVGLAALATLGARPQLRRSRYGLALGLFGVVALVYALAMILKLA